MKNDNNKPQVCGNSPKTSLCGPEARVSYSESTFIPAALQNKAETTENLNDSLVSAKYNSSRNLNSGLLVSATADNNDSPSTSASSCSGCSEGQDSCSPSGSQIRAVLGNCQISSLNSEERAKPKKKTRRGGKKARLRREKEKQRASANEMLSSPAPAEEEPCKKKIKYKTELCKNWIETGKCSYSVRCMFAHGYHELATPKVESTPVPAVQRQPCGKFHNELYCSYGTRCVYIHDERSLGELPNSYFAKNLLNLEARMADPCVKSRRLKVFEDLTRDFDPVEDAQEVYSVASCTKKETDLETKAPNVECCSNASDSTDIAGEDFEDVAVSIIQGF